MNASKGMKKDKIKTVSRYIYRNSNTPNENASPGTKKKKRKFQNTSFQDGTRLLDTLSQSNADESISGTQVTETENNEKQTTSGYDHNFISTMTTEEVNEHIHKCLEMSSENKITPKNAFALQLIDCMKLLLPKEDFSVMACTLDAGQKIYAYRIDGLHQQVVKLAEEVIKNNMQNGTEIQETQDAQKKESRKTSKKNILASADSLRRDVKSNDPKEKFIKLEGLPGAMMTSVKRDPQDLSFTMLNNVSFWQNWENYKPLTVNEEVEIPHCEIYRNKSEMRGKNNLQTFSRILHQSETVTSGSLIATDDESENMPCDLASSDEAEGLDNEVIEDDVDVITTALKRLNEEAKENKGICNVPSRFETMKMLFDQASDYHYLNMDKAYYWSGPKVWKRSKTTHLGCEEKTKVPRKKKDPSPILYSGPSAEKSIHTTLKKGSKLNKRTIMGWKVKNVTLAKDLKIGPRTFLDLFHMPDFLELRESQSSDQSNEEVDSVTHFENIDIDDIFQDDVMTNSSDNQDPLNSSFYENAPENCASSGSRDPLNSAFYDAGLNQQSENASTNSGKIVKIQFSCTPNSDTTLIPAPNMVKFEPIKYKTKPIRVDMKHLKETMWSVIDENHEKNEQYMREDPWGDIETQPKVKLSNVLMESLPRLEKRTAEDLSTGMALMSLLTLANENNLHLKNTNDYSDVEISFENSSPGDIDVMKE